MTRVALMQIHKADAWGVEALAPWLRVAAARGAELAVFPECFPFWHEDFVLSERLACELLCAVDCPADLAFVAGGYVRRDGEDKPRNSVFLVYRREIRGRYDKRIPWDTEERKIQPGTASALFAWSGHQCVPLICADVYGPQGSPAKARSGLEHIIASSAMILGPAEQRGRGAFVIVPSYAGVDEEWPRRLRRVSAELNLPVVFVNATGPSKPGDPLGDGKSAVLWPDSQGRAAVVLTQHPEVLVVDL